LQQLNHNALIVRTLIAISRKLRNHMIGVHEVLADWGRPAEHL
jgi:hypothetical protein